MNMQFGNNVILLAIFFLRVSATLRSNFDSDTSFILDLLGTAITSVARNYIQCLRGRVFRPSMLDIYNILFGLQTNAIWI